MDRRDFLKRCAAQEPERLEAMKQTLIELNAQIEAEGPDWWR